MVDCEYRVRRHAFEPERTWRVDGLGLSWQSEKSSGRFTFAEIRSIRLSFTPSRVDFARYRCTITRFNGWREEIVSTSYDGIAQFEDRAPAYAAFVRCLIASAAKTNPANRFEAGDPSIKYWLSLVLVIAAFALFAALLVAIGFNASWVIVAKLAVIGALLPTALKWASKNRPRRFTPDAVPGDVLPP